ncbi:glycoside hydrolase family 2 protein [Paenibacillus macerans]|uniref:glycoside hydrolase family 2 protein n=1 Tax=Paenibacillus macerans TaxID=44252 RepID=UPI00203A4C20|nr:sugar-binding domain-containing protein [Paenibacillus macerans]MCM3700210.1 beta galactosidase jelly roll domain-containing protein [Paenibacillus macerans]
MFNQVMTADAAAIPRPEFPRPDWERKDWFNLNGAWAFRFDPSDEGIGQSWQNEGAPAFREQIQVPFSWSSPLSGIGINEPGIGWYRRAVNWQPQPGQARIFLRFGAADYRCDVWVNGVHAGSHQGGYGAFEFEVTDTWKKAEENAIVVRVEDRDEDYQARGKQGYGEIRGIWQPVWLEARPENFVREARFRTFMDGRIEVESIIISGGDTEAELSFRFAEGAVNLTERVRLTAGENTVRTAFTVANPHLWSPETPYLYEGEIVLSGSFGRDCVSTYFGIRKIGTARFEDRDYRWITLNGKPVYLNGTLDQSYHQTGYFTYPSDEEMRDEIYLMKRIGLNFVRIHIKPEEPRKLYWADKLGILVMVDMPCFWGAPDERARASYESEAREVIARDYNHPAIFSWVMFNETWGLKSGKAAGSLTGDESGNMNYLPETQEWVRRMYRWAKDIDPTRLVEDNSPCNWDHVETDLNTWHFYINGYEQVRQHVSDVVEKTYPGSELNYIGGNVQTDAPLMNSECGNVWGIEHGAGDSDLAWHYRYMLNEFRRHDKMCGFVFTEFRDVTNEFNGYYRLDGTEKDFGYGDFVPGMTIADLHSPDFIVIDAPPCQTVEGGEQVAVSLLRSSYSDCYHGRTLKLDWELWYDQLGVRKVADHGEVSIKWNGYGVAQIAPLSLTMPNRDAVAVLAVRLLDEAGEAITRNFITFDVRGGEADGTYDANAGHINLPVAGFAGQSFTQHWDAIQGAKVSGAGAGAFAYEVRLPERERLELIGDIEIVFEASAKRVLARNIEGVKARETGIHFMHGAAADVEYNPNTYYMTDEERHTSQVTVSIDGEAVGTVHLPDDPADSRGVLSWHYQPVANRLDEAGSYGYLCNVKVPGRIAAKLDRSRSFRLELQAGEGGLALYGRNAGRYPLDILVRYR